MPRSRSGSGKKTGKKLNVAVLGSGGVGKSCLTAQFIQNRWIDSYDPTIEDTFCKEIEVADTKLMLEIQDTAGTEQFSRSPTVSQYIFCINPEASTNARIALMRDTYIHSNDVFLLVFSLISQSSLKELESLYLQMLELYEQRIAAAVPDLSAYLHTPVSSSSGSMASLPAVPFQSVDYNGDRKGRRKNRGPNPLTDPLPSATKSVPSTPVQSRNPSLSLPPLPFLIIANKSDLPPTQQVLSKTDIAACIGRWHRQYMSESTIGLSIPAPRVVTTSAKSRLNVDEAFSGVADIGLRFRQWIESAVPHQTFRNPFSRGNSSSVVPTGSSYANEERHAASRLPGRLGFGRSRGDTRASQGTTSSSSRTHRTQKSYEGTSSPPSTAPGSTTKTVPPGGSSQARGQRELQDQLSRLQKLTMEEKRHHQLQMQQHGYCASPTSRKKNIFSRTTREVKARPEIAAGGGAGGKSGGCEVM